MIGRIADKLPIPRGPRKTESKANDPNHCNRLVGQMVVQSSGNTHGLASSLRHTIEEQVSEALPPPHQPPPVSAPLTYADVTRSQPYALSHVTDAAHQPNAIYAPRAPPAPHVTPYRRPAVPPSNPLRTPDNKPICYYCRQPGHVERLCYRRVPRPTTVDEAYSYVRTEPPPPIPSHTTSDTSSSARHELIEAATVSQYQRLLRTQTGRRILERLGFEPQACSKQCWVSGVSACGCICAELIVEADKATVS
ncbi:hypothetical protein HPB50_013140 [Hyalomma asiaticum]|uniref:Uncharacterized protein n=1 Tax=Hyalomma asiaticum TaxID=266040 RepID=A0ACB7RHU5_HYAAI|nr:hypothetical protein HPB50_013140 [Hyalomma asiaticum]